MTVRELVQTIILEAPDMDADVYLSKPIFNTNGDFECKSYIIVNITNGGSNDSLFINLKDYD